MIGYSVYGQKNDTYAFREYPQLTKYQRIHQELVPDMSGVSVQGVARCEKCGDLLDKWDNSLSGIVIKKRKYDISSTYDGVVIVSQRFKSVYEAGGLSGLVFRQLPDDAGFFAIRASKVVEFDAERSKTRFINQCPRCGQFESVVTPYDYLKEGSEIGEREFVRTDLEFASGDEKHPLLLCAEGAATILTSARLKGLDLIRIKESNPVADKE